MRFPLVVAGIFSTFLVGAVTVSTISRPAAAVQPERTIDFARDVQPIFRQNCYGCHGPTQQMNGFRLDRRRDALRGGTATMIGPGNSAGSRLYLRLTGNDFGQQMPPTGPLSNEQVAVIKTWIDEGAHWPDESSGDQELGPIDPAATALVEMLRAGNFDGFRARVSREARLLNARGPGGATPFMFAAFYGDAPLVRELLDRGADVNARSDARATALMWAVSDPEKTRVLIGQGADVNARSDDGRTALLIAAGEATTARSIKMLIESGADVHATGTSLVGQATALTETALSGNEEGFRMLVAAGADLKRAGPPALGLSLRSECMSCADLLMKAFPPEFFTAVMMIGAPPLGPALATPMFLERGANVEARDPAGRSILMLAAASEALPVDAVKALLARKMNVNDRAKSGDTALGLARRHGDTPVVKLLLDAGAKDEPSASMPVAAPARNSRQALDRALPLLQRTDATFLNKSGCVSCHNNSLTAMTVAAAKSVGIRVDATIAADQRRRIGEYLESWRDRGLQGIGIPGDSDTVSYILVGLGAEGYPPDLRTDAQAYFLKRQQSPDGRWRIFANRPPIESSDLQVTALSLRALQIYAPPAHRAEYDKAIGAAAAWLRAATPRMTEDRVFQLLGMHWTKAPAEMIQQAGRALIAQQREDGGWAQLSTLSSDAYATGQALYALAESGVLRPGDPVYRRGIAFLLKTQLADGSWYVRTRAIPIQPLFDADFPHGADAFISAAATNWAALALSRD